MDGNRERKYNMREKVTLTMVRKSSPSRDGWREKER